MHFISGDIPSIEFCQEFVELHPSLFISFLGVVIIDIVWGVCVIVCVFLNTRNIHRKLIYSFFSTSVAPSISFKLRK